MLAVGEGWIVRVSVAVGVWVALGIAVREAVGAAVRVGSNVRVEVGCGDDVGVGFRVADDVGLVVAVGVAGGKTVEVAVPVAVGAAGTVAVGVAVAVLVAVRGSWDTATFALPPQLASPSARTSAARSCPASKPELLGELYVRMLTALAGPIRSKCIPPPGRRFRCRPGPHSENRRSSMERCPRTHRIAP